MGLDTYAVVFDESSAGFRFLTPEEKDCFLKLNIDLVGGAMSGNGYDGSFRGKEYSKVIQDITGEHLYQRLIKKDKLEKMQLKLQEELGEVMFKHRAVMTAKYIDMKEFASLVHFFTVCKLNGFGLYNSW